MATRPRIHHPRYHVPQLHLSETVSALAALVAVMVLLFAAAAVISTFAPWG